MLDFQKWLYIYINIIILSNDLILTLHDNKDYHISATSNQDICRLRNATEIGDHFIEWKIEAVFNNVYFQ